MLLFYFVSQLSWNKTIFDILLLILICINYLCWFDNLCMVPCLEFLEDSWVANTWNVVVVLMLMLFIFLFVFFTIQPVSPILSNLTHVSWFGPLWWVELNFFQSNHDRLNWKRPPTLLMHTPPYLCHWTLLRFFFFFFLEK